MWSEYMHFWRTLSTLPGIKASVKATYSADLPALDVRSWHLRFLFDHYIT
ncbi:MAG: hypothetical protein ACTINK_02940 [Kluyvera intermedia]